MSDYPYHESLRLQNFTAFADASFEFVPGINVFVGENGTGKTHAMKAMYAWQLALYRGDLNLSDYRRIYQVNNLGDLLRSSESEVAEIILKIGDQRWELEVWVAGSVGYTAIEGQSRASRPVFVPAIDMLGHTKAFVTTYDEYAIDFDLTHRDAVSLLLAPEKRELDDELSALSSLLEHVLGGKLELEGERFYLKTERGRFAAPTVAEGLRKIATLLRLVQCGWLRPGATLFWDEPEVNLNPKLMDEVAAALLALARNGVQIFLATHSYVMLEELKDQAEPGEVRYFGFRPSPDGVTVDWTDDLPKLDPNPILDQYESLSDRKLKKAFAPRARA